MRIQADDGFLEFEGEQIAAASSEEDAETLRWTEIHIFRTTSGKYIIQKIGRTRVFHRGSATGSCARYGKPGSYHDDVAEDISKLPCPVCNPELDTEDAVRIEQDRFSAHVSDTAKGAVESAHSQDDDQVTYLTRTARDALKRAAAADPEIHTAFLVQRVD